MNTFSPLSIVQEINQNFQNFIKSMEQVEEFANIEIGTTPKEEVYKEDKLILYKYTPQTIRYKTPLLICYALVNRPYMMDLQSDRSLIKKLIDDGIEVYLIDWGYPDYADRYLNLDDYINGYIDNCVDFICKTNNISQINLLGVCQGGTFSVCYSSLYQEKIKNLITMVTPIDFQTPDNLLSILSQNIDVDLAVDLIGNIPGSVLNDFFSKLKPMMLNLQKMVDIPAILTKNEVAKNFLRMEKWINDSPDQSGEAYREFIKWFYQENKLIKNDLTLGNRLVALKNITAPVLNIYAEQDHLVPPDSSKALKGLVASKDYEEVSFKGGHIGIYVSSKSQALIPPKITEWLKQRD